MADHLSAFFPEQRAALHDDELSTFIQTTIDRAGCSLCLIRQEYRLDPAKPENRETSILSG
jgi:hypothetical protein